MGIFITIALICAVFAIPLAAEESRFTGKFWKKYFCFFLGVQALFYVMMLLFSIAFN